MPSITDRFRYSIQELMEKCNLNELERFNFGEIKQERVSGLTAVKENPQMMIWGKPGSGKTTFLKYIAIQCLGEKILADHVPIFITLKDFADNCSSLDLLAYLQTQWQQQQIETDDLLTILTSGKALILLDGLDEVRQEYCRDVISQIEQFVNRFSRNNFLITCRIAAREYIFKGFQQVEIADFDQEQINTFVTKWYGVKNPVKGEKFLEKLAENKPIQELATNPLLLTLLCLVFETNSDFPISRSELYEEGVDVLLKKWDATRNIERDMVYKRLSLKRKEDLLSHLAYVTFSQGNYFFKQKDAENYISSFIRNLPDAKTDPGALLLDSQDVLKSIQSQHGLLVERAKKIFSFSHLTFHEYFTARHIASQGDQELSKLVTHLTEKRWYEVFLLVFETLPRADHLVNLIKQIIDNLVKDDEGRQKFLTWAKSKAKLINTTKFTSSQIRYLYFNLDFNLDSDFYKNLDFKFYTNLDFNLDLYLYFYLNLDPYLSLNFFYYLHRDLEKIKNLIKELNLPTEFSQQFNFLRQKVPNPEGSHQKIRQWLIHHWKEWQEEYRDLIVKYRNIGHFWSFNQKQTKLLYLYVEANKFLEECLQCECVVSPEVRKEIEDGLYLPTTEVSPSQGEI